MASFMAGAITRQRLMPAAKQTTSSCSMCSRFSAISPATNRAMGSTRASSSGRLSRTIREKVRMLWRWSTSRSRLLRL